MLSSFAQSFSAHPKRMKMLRRHLKFASQMRLEAAALKHGCLADVAAPKGSEWGPVMRLVEACRAHSRYKNSYNLPSSKRGWKRIQR